MPDQSAAVSNGTPGRFLAGYASAGGAAIAMSTLVLFVRQVSVSAETIVLARLGTLQADWAGPYPSKG